MAEGEVYNLDKLREGLVSIDTNIKAIEEALVRERDKRQEYLVHIAKAEAILELHGD